MAKSRGDIDDASRFLASTLHEIRTPIQTIISTVELFQDTNMDKEQREYIRQIQFSADVLLDLANNILDFTKIRSNEFMLESVPFNITELTEQVVDLISIEAFNRGLEIITDIDSSIPAFVTGDPVRVQQVILNLLKNAVKFTNQGYIHVELKKDGDKLMFSVTDTGIGITEDQKSKLFTNYYQADISTYRRFGGTGLGLSISKNLVTLMQGTIGVKSNPDGGSIFYFKIPLLEGMVDIESQPFKIEKKVKVLIIDDSPMAAKSLTLLLNNAGITDIQSVNSSEKSLELLLSAEKDNNPYTLIFVDMIMPGIDGWHLANEIKNSSELKHSPALYLLVPEGQMRGEAKMKMLNWFKGYLYKPFKRKMVQDLLKEAFLPDEEVLEELELANDETLADLKQKDSSFIAKNKKILVVEDHPVNRKLLVTFVQKFGADVYFAEDGQQAIEQIKEVPDIEIIFMDIQMPVKNGIEATRELRHSGYKGIIIACTANNDKNDFESYKKIGINDIIVKPFKSQAIGNILEKWGTIMELPEIQDITTLESDERKISSWDQEDFMDTIQQDLELGKSIISTFTEQTKLTLQNAETALEKSDFEELRKIGHSLCGSSGTISATRLADYGSRLNTCAKNMDIPGCRFNLDEFNHEFQHFLKVTKDFFYTRI